jgi:hypothetical protein
VSRSIFLCQNAEYQMKAYLLGAPAPLRPGEVKLAGSINVMPSVVARTWEYWSTRLQEAGFWPPHVKTPGEAQAKSAAAAGAAPASEKKKRA